MYPSADLLRFVVFGFLLIVSLISMACLDEQTATIKLQGNMDPIVSLDLSNWPAFGQKMAQTSQQMSADSEERRMEMK